MASRMDQKHPALFSSYGDGRAGKTGFAEELHIPRNRERLSTEVRTRPILRYGWLPSIEALASERWAVRRSVLATLRTDLRTAHRETPRRSPGHSRPSTALAVASHAAAAQWGSDIGLAMRRPWQVDLQRISL